MWCESFTSRIMIRAGRTGRHPPARAGFTLIELLVVIAIIAILAAVLFPVFARAREQARMTVCMGNVRQLGNAFKMYLDDYEGYFPSIGANAMVRATDWVSVNPAYLYPNSSYIIADVARGSLWPYVREKKVYVCPSDRAYYLYNHRKVEVSYMMTDPFDIRSGAPVHEDEITYPSSTIMLIEEGNENWHNDGSFYPYANYQDYRQGGSSSDIPADWHFGRGMVLFADCHAGAYLKEDIKPTGGVPSGGPYPKYFHWFQVRRDRE
jgi:prepilin-type N-terminal cleavage/methylation domain-containing protein